jgi:hypothetical protein
MFEILEEVPQRRRREDGGRLCWIAARLSQVWDFIDKRQVIRRLAFVWVLWLTGRVIDWTLDYAWHSNQDGAQIAMVIAAVWTPLAALQGAVFKFYDEGRQAQQ